MQGSPTDLLRAGKNVAEDLQAAAHIPFQPQLRSLDFTQTISTKSEILSTAKQKTAFIIGDASRVTANHIQNVNMWDSRGDPLSQDLVNTNNT